MPTWKRRGFCLAMLSLAACGGGDTAGAVGGTPSPSPSPAPSPAPSPSPAPLTGLYVSSQYASSSIRQIRDVEYSRRPNAGSQFTSELTRVAEQGSAVLVLRLDVSVPPNATALQRQPMVVWFHGGGLSSGSKEDVAAQALSYASAGYVAATVNFRLTPDNETDPVKRVLALQQAMDDAMNAIRYLKSNAATYGIDPTRVATFGNSAGGALSLVNAVEFDTLVNTVSDYPGISSRVEAAVSTGATLVDAAASADAYVHYDGSDSPVLLFHANPTDGTSGATWTGSVLPTQARINASGNSCTVVAQPDRSHTVDLSLGGAYWPATRQFLWDRLRLASLH